MPPNARRASRCITLTLVAAAGCARAAVSSTTGGLSPTTPPLKVPAGIVIQTIANVRAARELAALPNGDVLVGTGGPRVYIIPNAESAGTAGAPRVFATVGNDNAAGVAFSPSGRTVFIATEYRIWATPYRAGDLTAEHLAPIAAVRTGPTANPGDGDVHTTTSLAVSGSTLYASIGSSCNACTEIDPQRAAIWRMNLNGSNMRLVAKRIRNAIALAVNPASGHLWAADAGQDNLPIGHPYEFADDVTASAGSGVADYGWPYSEERHILYNSEPGAPANCTSIAQPLVEFAAYTTHVGAVFYPVHPKGRYAFPSAFFGALLVTSHGSWHVVSGCKRAPEVDAVAMNGDRPVTPVNWNDPTTQWRPLISGFQTACPSTRVGRPTGIAVGAKGSVFVADDLADSIYRLRP